MHRLFIIFIVALGTLIAPLHAFELYYHHDASGQRRDGSKLFDIVYELYDLGATDSVNIFVWAITQSGETLAFSTPDTTWGTFSGDTVRVIGSGIYHIVWNIGIDQPNREFYSDSIVIQVVAGIPGWRPGPCGTEIAIAAGYYHTVALKSDGTVWAWGRNGNGQLGDNTTTERHTPVQVHGEGDIGFLIDIIAISAGAWHTVALKSDGTVWAWGWNGEGELGDNTGTTRHTPVQVHGEGDIGFLTDIVAISAGRALKSDGTVWAWGSNIYGQLGDNTITDRHTPVQVHGEGDIGFLTDIIAISAKYYHTVALKSDGTVWAWGWNGRGQLGDNTTTDRHTPVQVHGTGDIGFLTDIIAIAAGAALTVALKSDGTVWAWGVNGDGQLGDNTTTNRYTPVQVHGEGDIGFLTDIIAIAAGYGYTVALKSDGTVWAWGNNGYGQLGDGTTTERHTPVMSLLPW